MKYWNGNSMQEDPRIDEFIADIVKVCQKHNLAISQQHKQGLFEIVDLDEIYIDWLKAATNKCRLIDEDIPI